MQQSDWEPSQELDEPSIDFRALITALWKGRYWVVACALLGGAAGLVMAAATPNTYTSTAKLLLRPGQREQLTPEAFVGTVGGESTRPTLVDELHLLHSRDVYQQVALEVGPAEILRLDDPRQFDNPETPAPIRWLHSLQAFMRGWDNLEAASSAELERSATKALQENTTVTSELMGNVISVTFSSTSPSRARSLADRIVAAFVARHNEQFSATEYLASSLEKVEQARTDYERARAAFNTHRTECGFLLVDTELQGLLADTHEIEQDQESSRLRFAQLEVELENLRERIKGVDEEVKTTTPAVTRPNEEYLLQLQVISTWIDRHKLLDEQGLSLEEKQRRSEEYERTTEVLRNELAAMDRDIVVTPAEVVSTDNERHIDLADRIGDMDLEAASLSRRMTEQADLLEAKREQLKSLYVCLNDHHHIEADIERKEAVYLVLAERYADLEALASIDSAGDSNLRVIHAPDLPWEKDGPNRKKTILLGLMGGAALASGLILLRHLMNNRIGDDPRSVDRLLGVPVLGVVHESKSIRKPFPSGSTRPGDQEAPS